MNVSRQAALLLLSAGLLLSGCSSSSDSPGGEGYTGPTLPARTVAEGKWQEGPAKPKQHKPYPYDINTHCGIKWLHFGGRWWVLDSVFPGVEQVKGEPPSRESERLAGYMTLIGPDTANFDAVQMPTMQFVPAEDEPPGCA
ncbi:hypothetical protein ACSCB1_04380 [Streptomyces europaeiscabiei]|uniref:Lipoprotein n=1 Tax=Streptomyces europaeiscabiei TaxID=146819 RepID=A0ABU4NKY6_9ACTN|nr:hypothetical protein [Streptomyces europaeiscabiei]MDX2758603.1 hypothetical protein [Streptomyces europaeiscabiei]MDX2768239.1 hypothetical protein [Streptomyces europaeiscabiei]MDX3545651.1 hypothetical protein [Streptomyces europaeiscabiei]MDX3554951.1 hypothetical protein [Streptomyces europaeiscabiei]MDX3670853.1 hypothetical protein [Streptomyces europaeiscabiei]